MKRLVIYFHFDAQGVVDVPCRYTVAAMQQWGQLVLSPMEPWNRQAVAGLRKTASLCWNAKTLVLTSGHTGKRCIMSAGKNWQNMKNWS